MATGPLPELTPPARKFWDNLPSRILEEILETVWCGKCRKGTPMQVRTGKIEGGCLILQGTCKICGGKVGRVVEPED